MRSSPSSRSVVFAALALVAATGCGGRSGLETEDGGSAGSHGAAGATGVAGSVGTAGTTGAAGSVGTAGATGAAGSVGTAGTTGAAGVTGAGGCGSVCFDLVCPWGLATDAAGCQLCACNPPPPCGPSDCGPAPFIPAHPPCPGGGTYAVTCSRNDAGACVWTGTCPMCTPQQCGPPPDVPSMICPDGSSPGPVCGLTPAGGCGWTLPKCPPVVCPAIDCFRACPNGARTDANGCPTCDCIEPTSCATYTDYKSCFGDMRCEWLQPGCGQPALATGGCFARTDVGCASDASCTGGRQCLARVVDPCYNPLGGATCAACGATQAICL